MNYLYLGFVCWGWGSSTTAHSHSWCSWGAHSTAASHSHSCGSTVSWGEVWGGSGFLVSEPVRPRCSIGPAVSPALTAVSVTTVSITAFTSLGSVQSACWFLEGVWHDIVRNVKVVAQVVNSIVGQIPVEPLPVEVFGDVVAGLE